jgi:putative membrane protein
MKPVRILFFASVVAAVGFASCSDDDDNNTNPSLTVEDKTFMQQAAFGNKAEITAGQMASTKGNENMVKMFGSMMVTDHSTAYDELEDMADRWNYDIPQAPDSMHQAKAQYLNSLSGYSFDTAYTAAQVMDHQKTVQLFQQATQGTAQQQLKAYAEKYLPKIQMHLQHADSILTALKAMGE